jgi:hypothetical protein
MEYLGAGVEVADGSLLQDLEGVGVQWLVDFAPPDLLLADRVGDDTLLLGDTSELLRYFTLFGGLNRRRGLRCWPVRSAWCQGRLGCLVDPVRNIQAHFVILEPYVRLRRIVAFLMPNGASRFLLASGVPAIHLFRSVRRSMVFFFISLNFYKDTRREVLNVTNPFPLWVL